MKQFASTLMLFLLLLVNSLFSQVKTNPTSIYSATSMMQVASIASRTNLKLAPESSGEAKDKKSGKNVSVYGKGFTDAEDVLLKRNSEHPKLKGRAPSIVFDAASSNSQPTDPAGAVGPNHYIVVFNTGYRIFDKLGNPLTDQLDTSTIFPQDGCCDLTCSYDTQAGRFVMTFLGNGVQVAVSQTSDPIADGWYVYNFPMNTDYQKLSIWSDGYYLTANKDSGSADTSEVVFAMDRTKMLLGDPTAQIVGFPLPGIVTSGFYSPQAFNATSLNFPAPGNVPIVYLQDDAWSGVTSDHLKLWTIDMNWNTPISSTISTGQTLPTAPFVSVFDGGSFVNLTQPNGGQDIDALQATIMNQAQFRKFPSHNSAIFNFVVDTKAGDLKLAGVRWYELRQSGDGQPWSIFQEGTYTAPDGKHAWNASMGMDSQGNIGMGYTGMGGSNNQVVSSYYTGRYANDPIGTMTIAENVIALGNANIPGTRYGDYSKLAIDPVDDKSFWFINEYMNSGRKDVVGVFKIAPNFNLDIGVVAITAPNNGTLSNAQPITVSIFNYGLTPVSGFQVSYQIDGGTIVTETFSGTINSAEYATYTFSQTANLATAGQTYTIKAFTTLFEDEDTNNDATIKSVQHLYPNDIGVSAIVSPISGSNLTASESITVKITNFGGQAQTNFNVGYTLDGNSFSELFSDILPANSTVNYTFSQAGNFAAIGNHVLSCATFLTTDSALANNSFSTTIVKVNCQPNQDCDSGDGLQLFQVGTINNPSTCGLDGYSDFTALSTELAVGSTNNLTLKTGFGDQFVSVWIDFNDDFVFSTNERVVTNFEIADGEGSGNFTETTDLIIPASATLGEHFMRAKTNWNNQVPDDACTSSTYGETEDYKVDIVTNLAKDNFATSKSQLIINYLENNNFDINFENKLLFEPLLLTVYTITGQKVVHHQVKNTGGKYVFNLDMSFSPAGIYLVRLGNNQFGKVKKILVK